jgi:acyl dehydratase
VSAKYWWEDFTPGLVLESAGYLVTADEIVEFARKYDPQPFHVDAKAALESPFGGLVASGWMTTAICMRLFYDQVLSDAAGAGSPGVDELRWTRPVRPGDTLRVKRTVLEAAPSKRRPEIGSVRSRAEVYNQRDELVMHLTSISLFRRREPGSAITTL